MPIDDFWISLLVKMLASGLLVVAATVTAERAGPFWGALIASLPVSAGPIYVMLALEHTQQFIEDGLLGSLVALTPTAVYMYALAVFCAGGSVLLGIGFGLFTWAVISVALARLPWTLEGAAALYVITIAACMLATAAMRRWPAAKTGASAWYDIPLRALLVGGLAATVTSISHLIGPEATGFAAVFPIVMTSIALIMYVRAGGRTVATIMANSFLPMLGFGMALIAGSLTMPHAGVWLGLLAALGGSLGWSLVLVLWRLRRRT